MDQPYFPGVSRSSDDFKAVRTQQLSRPLYIDIALDNARSITAGTALLLQISGNSFYVDQKPDDGNAIVHFQDSSLDISSVPFYIAPGIIIKVPFTQLLLENSAQVGKKVRIIYGVDVDFTAGISAQVTLTGTQNVVVTNTPTVLLSGTPAVTESLLTPNTATGYASQSITVDNTNQVATVVAATAGVSLTIYNRALTWEETDGNIGSDYVRGTLFAAATSTAFVHGTNRVNTIILGTFRSLYSSTNISMVGNSDFHSESPIVLPAGYGVFMYARQEVAGARGTVRADISYK